MAIALAGEGDTFITLTVNPARFSGPDERAQRLSDAWKRVKRAACRKYGYPTIPYLAVFERTERGEPHLHILARCRWIDQRWLSRKMADLIGAPICHIRRIDSIRKAAAYVAKYIQKDPHKFKGVKRYFRTLDWEGGRGEPEGPPRPLWLAVTVKWEPMVSYLRAALALGFSAKREGDTWYLHFKSPAVAGGGSGVIP